MEKRFFLAFLITLAFFIVYTRLTARYQPQPLPSQDVREEIGKGAEQVPRQKLDFPGDTAEAVMESEELPQQEIGHFVVTYSPLGGYIHSISIEGEEKELPFQNIGFSYKDNHKEFSVSVERNRLIFSEPLGQKKEFIFKEHTLELKLDPPPSNPILLFSINFPTGMLNPDQRYYEVFYSQNGVLKRGSPQKIKENQYENVDFAGGRDRYYCFSLVKGSYQVNWEKSKSKGYLYLASPPSQILFYLGPQTEKNLKFYELQGVIYYGFFHSIGVGMVKLLYFFYSITKNWGLSLILFSALIYLVLFPLTAKSTKAMKRIQEFQPEIEALKAKYKDNPQKLQKETMELYRKHKINPLGGCLPLFFQFPVFIALYQVLFRFVDLKGAHFLWIKDLSAPDRLFSLPFTIPFLKASYFNLLPILIAIFGLLQQKLTMSSVSSSQQKSMGLFMSIFIGVIFYRFPSALVLYWLTQNLLTITYQMCIRKT